MAIDNAYSHPSTYAVGNISDYPNLSLAPATGTPYVPTFNTLANSWDAAGYPGLMVDPLTTPMILDNYNSPSMAVSYFPQPNYYPQPLYAGGFPPEVLAPPQTPHAGDFLSEAPIQPLISYPSNFLSEVPVQPQPVNPSSWGGSFAADSSPEEPHIAPAPIKFPFGGLGENEDELPLGTFNPNLHTDYQSRAGLVRTTPIRKRHSHLFDPYHARALEHVNAGPGISTSPPCIPSVGLPTVQPPGGYSMTTADADNVTTHTEEDETQVPKRTRALRGTGKYRKWHDQVKEETPKLIRWAKMFKGLPRFPNLNEALAVAAEAIPMIRGIANQQSLRSAAPRAMVLGPCSKAAMKERRRRGIERRWCQVLSQYYPLSRGKLTRAQLFSAVVRDVETHPVLRRTPNEGRLALGAPKPMDAALES